MSAVAPQRPQFDAALAALNPGDTLVIWKMDRAFRNLLHALQVLQQFERRAVDFQSLTDGIDTNTPIGRFAYQIANAFSELERALIRERTKAGMAAAKRRGKHVGRPRKLTAYQVVEAQELIGSGEKSRADVAALLGVDVATLRRALAEHGREASRGAAA